jgi:glycosyltransferase involved in cell wall biosynthesis
MRFVLVSTHVDQTTGYSKVSFNLLSQLATLAPKVKTYHFGFQRHPDRKSTRKVPDRVVSYDAAANEDPKEEGFGFNKIHEYLDMVNPDVVMIYNDPLVICKFFDSMKLSEKTAPYKVWVYVDQVYTGIAAPLIDKIRDHADKIYCFTDSWATEFKKYGIAKEIGILEHAVDSTVFSRVPSSVRMGLRSAQKIAPESIVFLNANRNSQRKRLDLTLMGFVQLLARTPTAPLYLMFVTVANPQAGAYYDLHRIYLDQLARAGLNHEDFKTRLMIVDTTPPNTLTDEVINQIYNMTDIGINTSDGEGFGLCQLEHMYAGAPQVVTDVGSYRSFLDRTVADFIPTSGSYSYFPGSMPLGLSAPTFMPNDVADAMEAAIKALPERRAAIATRDFPKWDSICSAFLADVRHQASV